MVHMKNVDFDSKLARKVSILVQQLLKTTQILSISIETLKFDFKGVNFSTVFLKKKVKCKKRRLNT